MKDFLKQMLSGDGVPSSKRGVLIWFTFLFTALVLVDLITGKHPQDMYSNQVFEMLMIAFAGVFGEKAITWLMTIRGKSSPPDNLPKT